MKTVTVRFLETRTVQDASRKTFLQGEVHQMTEDSAHHWVRRGVAEIVPVSAAVKAEPVPASQPAARRPKNKSKS